MNGIMADSINRIKRLLNEKAQGIVEFALLCAVCAALAIIMIETDITGAFESSLESSKGELYAAEIGARPRNDYMKYYREWNKLTSQTIKNLEKDNSERIKADQKALTKIAETYLGKTEGQVLNLMDYFSNSPNQNNAPDYNSGNSPKYRCDNSEKTGTGFANGVLIPLSYASNSLNSNGNAEEDADRRKGWLWLDSNNNQNLVSYLTDGEGKTYDKFDRNNPVYNDRQSNLKTVTTDRLFYSNDVLDTVARVTVRLHYTNGKVDFVDIALRNQNSTTGNIGENLCIHVTETGYSTIQTTGSGGNDIINKPKSYYNDDGTPKS